jgi:hypothetical protein
VVAKNKSKGRSALTPIPDIRETFALHLKANQRLDALLEEVRELQGAGKIREARRVIQTCRAASAATSCTRE